MAELLKVEDCWPTMWLEVTTEWEEEEKEQEVVVSEGWVTAFPRLTIDP